MTAISKRMKHISEKAPVESMYSAEDAFDLLKELSVVKFKESVDVSINLGVDTRKSDQVVRGATVLPNGSGKTVKVAVFAEGDLAEEAKNAGADIVGFEDLAELVKKGELDADVVVATPDAMPVVGKVGKILGPKGLMPNPKSGTVTKDISSAIANIKSGQASYRTDKSGIIHCRIGQIDFDTKALAENLNAVIADLKRLKPSSSKGSYFKKITVSSTMGPGLVLDKAQLVV